MIKHWSVTINGKPYTVYPLRYLHSMKLYQDDRLLAHYIYRADRGWRFADRRRRRIVGMLNKVQLCKR